MIANFLPLVAFLEGQYYSSLLAHFVHIGSIDYIMTQCRICKKYGPKELTQHYSYFSVFGLTYMYMYVILLGDLSYLPNGLLTLTCTM